MSFPSKSKKLYETFQYPSDHPYIDKDVGIEIELEGHLVSSSTSKFWTVKEEGSLRDGGIEYVLKRPVTMGDLPKALEEFREYMDKSAPSTTIRCSTHIHVNILQLTEAQVYNVMLCWYLLEDLLVQTQSNNRQGNLFCLRLSDAEDLALSIKESLANDGNGFNSFYPERNRYAALNLCAITRFGSLEFRFMDAMTDPTKIFNWATILHNIVHNAKDIEPLKLLSIYDELNANDFLGKLIGSIYVPYVLQGLPYSKVTRLLHTNYDYVFELAHLLKSKKFTLPRNQWDSDLSSSSDAFEGIFTAQTLGNISTTDWIQQNFPPPQATPPSWSSLIIDDLE